MEVRHTCIYWQVNHDFCISQPSKNRYASNVSSHLNWLYLRVVQSQPCLELSNNEGQVHHACIDMCYDMNHKIW